MTQPGTASPTTVPPGDGGVTLRPSDVRLAASVAREALLPLASADWSRQAYDLDWDCWQTWQHVTACINWYAMLLASPSPEPFRLRRLPRAVYSADFAIDLLLELLERQAAVLAVVAAAADPSARGFHVWGKPDASGYVAMGCAEILLHTDDIVRGHGQTFQPPDDLCRRVVDRLFPWAPADIGGWSALSWVTGRIDLEGFGRVPANWAWHASPLSEWDGTMKTRASYDG